MHNVCASVIYLGKIELRWCHKCNLPVLGKTCGICGGETEEVKLTPPGDVRPAFPFDIELCRKVIEEQFGDAVLPEVVLLNDVPSIDKMDEVIFNGKVAGALQYDVEEKKFRFIPRVWFAAMIKPAKGFVVADKGAVSPILNGSSLLAPGVIDASPEIKRGDEVIVLSPEKEVIAVGKAYMGSEEMVESKHGMAVKIRWKGIEKEEEIGNRTWEDVIEANRGIISKKVSKSVNFIRNTIENNDLPAAVSFSGGKDSLATLFLVLDAGYRLPIFFINTGLEFEETVNYVHEVARKLNLELIEESAGDIFWKAIDFFGPSAKDYRWCCKTCKLGPTTRLIKKNFPDGVLSFIGQRRYESEQRAKKGSIWKNPWVSGQLGASPVQNWTALHIWLYIFMKSKEYGIKWNELYEHGFSRIGCWLCPASDMAEFEFKRHKDWGKFENKLKKFAYRHNLPEEWIYRGLWRWRHPPKWEKERYEVTEKREYKIEGNEERIENFLKIIGDVKKVDEREYEVDGIRIHLGKGIKASEKESLVKDVVYKAINCVGCGVCMAKCPQDAISIIDGKAYIGNECMHCLKCMEECPVIVFR